MVNYLSPQVRILDGPQVTSGRSRGVSVLGASKTLYISNVYLLVIYDSSMRLPMTRCALVCLPFCRPWWGGKGRILRYSEIPSTLDPRPLITLVSARPTHVRFLTLKYLMACYILEEFSLYLYSEKVSAREIYSLPTNYNQVSVKNSLANILPY